MPVNQFLRRAQPTPYAARRINQELYMSSSDRGRDDATGTQRDPAVPADSPAPGTDAYANWLDRKSTRLNSSHSQISYAVFCLKKKKITNIRSQPHKCYRYPVA